MLAKNKLNFDVFKNISRVMNDLLFLRWKIGLKKSFIIQVYTVGKVMIQFLFLNV